MVPQSMIRPLWFLKVSLVIAYDGVQMETKLSSFPTTIYWITQSFFNDWNCLLYCRLIFFIYRGLLLGYLFRTTHLVKSHMITLFYWSSVWVKDKTLISNNNSFHFDSVYSVPGTILNSLYILTHFAFTTTLWVEAVTIYVVQM